MRRAAELISLLTFVIVAGLVTGCTSTTPITSSSSNTGSPSPQESLLPSPTASVSTVGGLAEGFPTDLIVVPEDSEVLVSAAELDAATGLTEVSLNLRSMLTSDELLAAIRPALLAAGFVETPGDAAANGLAAVSTFVHGNDQAQILTLGILDRDGIRTVTVGGSVRI